MTETTEPESNCKPYDFPHFVGNNCKNPRLGNPISIHEFETITKRIKKKIQRVTRIETILAETEWIWFHVTKGQINILEKEKKTLELNTPVNILLSI